MFDLSENNKGESGRSGSGIREIRRNSESFSQVISGCPSILTGLSREMRTQMNAIVAFTFLLNKKEYGEDEREEFSNQIYSSCEQIIAMFDDFLDSAIIDAGNIGSEPAVCNPDEMFGALFSEFNETLRKNKYKDIILVHDSPPFQNSYYLIDANRLARVIRNLFRIALVNTKSGYIKAGYDIRKDKLTFFLLDSGQGYVKCREFLQSHDMNQSLSKFNDTFTAVSMVLTRKLVQMMEGSIWIESNGFSGSSTYFSVPVICASNTENEMNRFSNTMSTI